MTPDTAAEASHATCLLCDHPATRIDNPSAYQDVREVECERCGTYWIDGLEALDVTSDQYRSKRWILSGLSLAANRAGGKPLYIAVNSTSKLIASAPLPRSPLEIMDELLELFASAQTTLGSFSGPLQLRSWDHLRFFLPTSDDLAYVLDSMQSLGWIKELYPETDDSGWTTEMTVQGWHRANELRTILPRSDQAFVAMRFDDSMLPAFHAIERALKETGYRASRIDLEHYNDSIMDQVIAEIRRSVFVVADVTHHRNGVYFEGGFARGIGIPVIWCCRADDFDGRHFDIQHLNTIKWSNEEELFAKLYQRVRATAPVRDPRA